MNPASRHNAQLENDDEERDLDAATKFDANEKSQRGSGKMNDEIKQQRQVLEKVSISASKIPSTNNRNEEKYVKKMTTSEKKTFPQKVTTTELNDTQKMTNKKFEKEKKVENVDVSPPPEPLPPQIAKASTPVPNRKYSGGGGRKSADKAVLVQNSEQGDKVERIFKLDLNALPFVPSAKSATKGAKSATIVNSNVTAVSSAPTPMMSGSLVVYNNTATPVTNNLVTVANNFGNNFMANQMIPIPTATLQPFQYAQIQHTHIPQAQPPLSHQQLPAHVLSRSPPVQPQQQQHIQQGTMMPATLHQTQHAAFQQQQQVAGFYAAAGAEGTNLSAYVLNWGAANANNFGNNFMANQMIPVPTATLQPFQYAQIQAPIPQTQPQLSHQQLPAHVLSRSPSVQPQQQQHVQQAMMPATLHQTQHAAFQQQQQVAGFYAAAGAEGTNLSAYVLNWGAANANNFGNNFMANQMIPVPTATLQPFQQQQPH
ncbi:hypothetical protein Mgra_00009461 [Meloidogyne graminicola]|uniref:Uncharacterized protein n=1 Tax=Meloidogyne graminicola TaxID=189291 RepID=A0A8S9ZBX9_9BILA|nr:hypothetical protein Mgra_00009461 [Meloidogyne graminicola]